MLRALGDHAGYCGQSTRAFRKSRHLPAANKEPRDSNIPQLGIIPQTIAGSLCKEYSLIKGYWSLWEVRPCFDAASSNLSQQEDIAPLSTATDNCGCLYTLASNVALHHILLLLEHITSYYVAIPQGSKYLIIMYSPKS